MPPKGRGQPRQDEDDAKDGKGGIDLGFLLAVRRSRSRLGETLTSTKGSGVCDGAADDWVGVVDELAEEEGVMV